MNTMRDKRYIFLVLLLSVGVYVLYTGAMYALDPLQIFHKASPKKAGNLNSGMRFQAAGIINSYPFDSIILGTSMAENFSPKEASSVLGGSFVNLSLSGSRLSERSLVLNYTLKKKRLEHVIISLDGFAPTGKFRDDFPVSNFDFLYNNSKFDDLKIYSNLKYAKYALCSLDVLYNNISRCTGTFKSLENIVAWWPVKEHSRRFGGLDQWFKAKNNGQIKVAFKQITDSSNCIKHDCKRTHVSSIYDNAPESFDAYILKYVKAYPSTQFHLFFPPYSRLRYAMWEQETPSKFTSYLNAIKYIVHQSELYSNLHIYGFEDMKFPDDIANYKDPAHYHQRFNSKMLHWMKSGEHELSNGMLSKYLKTIKFKAEHYDVITTGNKIEKYLNGVPNKQ